MTKLKHLADLTRWKEWMFFILPVLAGVLLGLPDIFTLSMLTLFASFALINSFGFVINDYFDAQHDKLKSEVRNPISLGLVGKKQAAVFCVLLAAAGFFLSYLFLPGVSFISMTLLTLVYFLYSSRPFRFKERTFAGVLTHGAAMPLLLIAGSMTLETKVIVASLAVFFMSMILDMTQEVRDMDSDRKAKHRTTAVYLGYKNSFRLIVLFAAISWITFICLVVFYMPIYWLLPALGAVFYTRALLRKPQQKDIFEISVKAWNKGIPISIVISIILLPFYLGLI